MTITLSDKLVSNTGNILRLEFFNKISSARICVKKKTVMPRTNGNQRLVGSILMHV